MVQSIKQANENREQQLEIREGLPEEMSFLLRPERIQGAAMRGSEQRAFQKDRGTRVEGPVGMGWAGSRNRTE